MSNESEQHFAQENQPAPAMVLLAAGGTGGHVFPAEALARALLRRGLRVALATDPRGGKFSPDLALPVYKISARPLSGGLLGNLRGLFAMALGVIQAALLLHKLKPDLVVGFGGYPSLPTLYAAGRMGIKIMLHEQNAVLGRANQFLAALAQRIAISFDSLHGTAQPTAEQRVLTGNPVRPAIAALRHLPYPQLTQEGPLHILVLGGSQGAKIFSQIVPAAVALLAPALQRRLRISQQCRAEDLAAARKAYAAIGMDVDLAPFFRDVPQRLAEAHLFIGRAGASTVAEITCAGRPAIFVPYPHGHQGEQQLNAEAVANAAGAWLIPQQAFTPQILATRLEALLNHPEFLQLAAKAAHSLGQDRAAESLADAACALLSQTDAIHSQVAA